MLQDKTLNGVTTKLQTAGTVGFLALIFGAHLDAQEALFVALGITFAAVADQVAYRGGLGALLVDSAGRVLDTHYSRRVAVHEAGHFLVAYLMGICPKAYTLSAWDAYKKFGAFNVQAGTIFCDAEFQREVQSGKLRGSSLDQFSCVALAGVASEFLRYGAAEGGTNDIMQLDALLRALGFTQKKADAEIRWALLNTVMLLRRYSRLQDR